jgi:uncharacterized glyoxalase superfamily protein PhnB
VSITKTSASACVEVAADPARAFEAFSGEIDSWWVRGPINFFDAARAVEMRIEPGVGGRILEVYEGDALELGKVTVWEPGARLTFLSSVDDTEIVVRFEPVANGTRVHVTQSLVPGGERALLFWPKALVWLGNWHADGHAREIARVSVALYYEDPASAARWLSRTFHLNSWSGVPEEGDEPDWIELHHGNVAILLFNGARPETEPRHAVWVYVDDLDAHYAHVRDAGARILSEIGQHGYRAYTAEDCERHRWVFAQARPTMR